MNTSRTYWTFVVILMLLVNGITGFTLHETEDYPFQKKVEKVLKKLWKGQSVKLTKLKNKSNEKQVYSAYAQNDLIGFLVIDEAIGCQIGGCDLKAKSSTSSMNYETFFYMVVFDKELTLRKVSVLQYTSDFGYEICAKRWLRQFEGLKNSSFDYGKEVDAISGATISGKSLVKEIQECVELLHDFEEGS